MTQVDYCPLGGFLVENRRFQKTCVCLSAKDVRFTEVLLHRLPTKMPFGVLSEPSKEGPKSLSFKPCVETFSGTTFFHHFFIFGTKISAGEPQSIIEAHPLFANLTDRDQEVPFQGGDMPRVQTSTVPKPVRNSNASKCDWMFWKFNYL